jgi:hypothetical protein
MRAARASAPPKLMDFGSGHLVDIGLIDIQVFFDGPMDLLVEQLKTDSTRFLDENLKHVDWLCSRVFHDQMVLVFACHVFTAGGDRRVHYHNVIFGLRKEIRDGHELIGPLDMEPLVRALDRRIRVGLVAGIAS